MHNEALVFCSFPPPFIGGSVVYIYNLVTHCPVTFDILTRQLGEGESELSLRKDRLLRKKFIFRGGDLTPIRRLFMVMGLFLYFPYLVTTKKYKVIILNMEVVWNSFLILYCKLLKVKTIGVAYAEEVTMGLNGSTFSQRIKRMLLKHVYKRADGFVSCCDFTKELLVTCGVEPQKICVIAPMLLEEKAGKPTPLNPHTFHLLSVGTLIRRKGFDLLIRAVLQLRNEFPDIKLTIVGNGPEKEPLEHLISASNLEACVAIDSHADNEQLSLYYQQCNIFVLANVTLANGNCEGSPTVFIEASSYGRPIVAGETGGISTVVDDGVTGFLVDPQDVGQLSAKIRLLFHDRDLARKMGQAGIKKAFEQHHPLHAGKVFHHYLLPFLQKGGMH